jgi:hypothetical protein
MKVYIPHWRGEAEMVAASKVLDLKREESY